MIVIPSPTRQLSATQYFVTTEMPATLVATMISRLPSTETRHSPLYSESLFPAEMLSDPYEKTSAQTYPISMRQNGLRQASSNLVITKFLRCTLEYPTIESHLVEHKAAEGFTNSV